MDFLRRGAEQPQNVRSNAGQHSVGAPAPAAEQPTRTKKNGVDLDIPKWLRIVSVVLLFSLAILAISVTALSYADRSRTTADRSRAEKLVESRQVDSSKVQAVFLTNGQVYFGKIKEVNASYVNLQDIYYLNSQSQAADDKTATTQPTSFSLVKLGCELHSPLDKMIINRQQVSFWENLNDSGKVAKGIDQWKSENPTGQKCTETSTGTQQSATTDTSTKKQ